MSAARSFIRKRRVPRRKFKRQVGVLIRGEYHIVDAEELGEGGMLLRSPIDLEVDQQVVVSFRVPGMVHVVTRGVVRYVKKANSEDEISAYGLQFETVDFDARRRIRSFVAMKQADDEC